MKINKQRIVNSLKEGKEHSQSVLQPVCLTRAFTLCCQYVALERWCRYDFTNKARTQADLFLLEVHSGVTLFNLSLSCWRSEYQKSSVICLIVCRWLYLASQTKVNLTATSPSRSLSLILFFSLWHLLQTMLVFFVFFCLLSVFLS